MLLNQLWQLWSLVNRRKSFSITSEKTRNLIDLDTPLKYRTIHRTYGEGMAYVEYLENLRCDKCNGTRKDIHLAPATIIFTLNGIRTTIFFTGIEGKYPQEMNLCGDCIEAIVLFSLKHMPRMASSLS